MRRFGRLGAALWMVVFSAPAFASPKHSGAPKHSGSSAPKEVKLSPKAPAEEASAPAPSGSAPPTRGPTRIDFDDRLIQGQSNKSGAVYLYDRKELKTRSMVKKRESFRDEIITSVFDT